MRQYRQKLDYYIHHESEVSQISGKEKILTRYNRDLTSNWVDDGNEDSRSDLSFVVPNSDVEYIESASPQTPTVSPSRLSVRYEQVRRSRRRRSSRFIIESSSPSNRSSSPCSQLRGHGERSPIMQQDSLLGRFESAILALDQLKNCLQGMKMEIDQVLTEGADYRPWCCRAFIRFDPVVMLLEGLR